MSIDRRRPAHRAARALLPLLTALLMCALTPPAARAATFTVTALADDGSPGTLRAAFAGVQASTDVSDTVTIRAQGTIPLTGGELLLSNPGGVAGKTVTVTGPGAGALFVSGGHAPNGTTASGSRVFHFSGLAVSLSSLAVINGFVNGGTQSAGGVALGGAGVLAQGGTLTMDHCVVEDCFVNLAGAFGGGVAGGNAALTLTHCVITSDQVSAFNGGGGGGIGSVLGSLAMTDCTINFNGESGFGGGIGSLNEPLALTRCTVSNNTTLNTNRGNAYGGGVYSQNGVVTLTDCTVSGNASSTAGNGLYLKFGSATLTGCTINGNATGGGLTAPGFVFDGGGLYVMGAGVGVTNCTFTGNSADVGGAIYNLGGTLTLSDSTVARNSGGSASGTTGAGVFVASGATATVTGTILVGNSTFNGQSDVTNQGTVTSGGSNLIGNANGNGFTNGVNHDQTGVSQTQAGVSATLADNGGPTQTMALLPTSPAIDADYADATPTDQRGAARPVGARNDTGAYEYGATATPNVPDTFVVTNTNDDGDGSLRRAVNSADADPGARIIFDSSVFGVPHTITLTSGPLILRQSTTIAGPGQRLLAVSGNSASRVFNISAGTANISGLTVEGGTTSGAGTLGGGIFVLGGALNLTDCTVSGNTAGGQNGAGGGIEAGGPTTLVRCTIVGNSAPNGSGGGVDASLATNGGLTLTGCTVAGNSAASGGGMFTSGGFATLNDCTLSGNSATQGGGADTSGLLFLTDCTVSGNTATSGGGLDTSSGGLIFLSGSTVSANAAGTGSGLNNESGATFFVSESILAGNTGGANVAGGGTVTSQGSNLIGDPDGSGFTNGVNNDQTGVTDPRLGPLQNNGGPTPTMALLSGSPAIDADFVGNSATDQRGATRPVGVRNDIGAYEYGALIAADDAYTASRNATLTVAAPGVLGNDSSDGSALAAAVQAQPTHGTLTLKMDGSFSYTPAAGFLGTDVFTYQARNAGGQAGTATVTLTVSAPSLALTSLNQNSAPVNSPDVSLTLTGSGFVGGASMVGVTRDGVTRVLSSSVTDANTLQAVIPARLLTTQGTLALQVSNPGGAVSGAKTFTVGTPAVSAQLSLSRSGAGPVVATIIVSNIGTVDVANVRVTGSTLGGSPGTVSAALLGLLPAGASRTVTATYASYTGRAGTRAVDKVSGVYDGGAIGGGFSVTVP